jgi:hypothetical protein
MLQEFHVDLDVSLTFPTRSLFCGQLLTGVAGNCAATIQPMTSAHAFSFHKQLVIVANRKVWPKW